ncbi:MAG TPA: cytochrome P460 family protein [Bryobacteraceae bacterium]|nr:cytochrome P460 family protein [Bryobacteraceae bacterium]
MRNLSRLWLPAAIFLLSAAGIPQESPPRTLPQYTSDGQMKLPSHYREWIYLTSGFDMSYSAAAMQMDQHTFDNVFVNPDAYSAFMKTGKWPDNTMLVLEGRRAADKGSINKSGNYQAGDVTGVEIHVKDSARFPGGWAFFAFGNGATAKMIPVTRDCYSCHQQHGAVDTTFVQFYPTLLPVARAKGTLRSSY